VSALEQELLALEGRVKAALDSGDPSRLPVLGYGEISLVLELETTAGAFAVRRLPPFPDPASFHRYRSCLEAYLAALQAAGIAVHDTTLVPIQSGREVIVYCAQPKLPAEAFLPRALAQATPEQAAARVAPVIERVIAAVGPHLGLDAQLSNWAQVGDRLLYVDVTTPLLRDDRGAERLDLEVFLASLPYLLRGLVRRFVLRGVLDAYYSPRGVLRDLLCNLFKEGLDRHLEVLLPAVNTHLDPPLRAEELRRHYAQDARTWAFLLLARRIDRAWQRHVRRRPYAFLLPRAIDRRLG
jgi:hypothetical protein